MKTVETILGIILVIVKYLGILSLITMSTIGLFKFWSDYTTLGFIAFIISIFGLTWSATELMRVLIKD